MMLNRKPVVLALLLILIGHAALLVSAQGEVPSTNSPSTTQQPSIPGIVPAEMIPYQFKPETKDELFARIDVDNDHAVTLEDYMKRDKYYVESVKNEFNTIDANQDGKMSKQEFDDYIKKLEDQRRVSLLQSSNYTLTKHDTNHDHKLSQAELGAYINGTLQRSVAKLPEVFKKYDKDGDGLLDLDEFSELDFHFPWDQFPLNENAYKQIFGAANGAHPPGMGIPPPQTAMRYY